MISCQDFPETVEEFMEEYKMVDTEEVYSNGTEFVPIFRMKQWFEHERAKKLDEWCTDCKEYDRERHCCPRWNRVIREALNDAQPEQKTGKWILVSQGVHGGYFECSECGNRALYAEDGVEELSKHCPNCGVKMEEDNE